MELIFLGTGAADWSEKDFIDGREYRRYSSALIDGSLLIDPGPHILHFAQRSGTPDLLRGVKNVLITHSHSDHLCPERVCDLIKLCAPRFFGDAACLRKLQKTLDPKVAELLDFTCVCPFDTYDIGGFSAMPVQSNHGTDDPDEVTLNYVIEREGKRLFYGLDGAWLLYPVWRRLRELKLDAAVLEATGGDVAGDDRIFGHNILPMLEIMLETFRRQGCLAPGGKIYCSHMAKTLHTDHATLQKRLAPVGIIPAFDGMTVKI